MAALIQLNEQQKMTLALFALAHQYGRLEPDEEDGRPCLRFDIPIPPEIRDMAFRNIGSVWVSSDKTTVSLHKWSKELLGDNVDPEYEYRLIQWARCPLTNYMAAGRWAGE